MNLSGNLIAYFSRRGENYVRGSIVNLKRGNTEIVASKIKDLVGGDLFAIEPADAYPASYSEATEMAKQELRNNARPKLASLPDGIAIYGTVFLGYPNWFGTMPMPVFTFLESFDFSGKHIVPFCTNEGSGLGRSVNDIAWLCDGAEVRPGLSIEGGRVLESDETIKAHLSKLGFIWGPHSR